MKVKICGITDFEVAERCVLAGADALGFVFAESRRSISVEHAREITSKIPPAIVKVGVFVNEEKKKIAEIVESVGLDAIQLHGDESAEFCASFSLPVIKAMGIYDATDLIDLNQFQCDYLLLDSPQGKYRGGNGTVFDWELVRDSRPRHQRLILAGGLTPDNVTEGIKIVKPYMVDVSSGVETEGHKDPRKITEFIRKAKEAGGE